MIGAVVTCVSNPVFITVFLGHTTHAIPTAWRRIAFVVGRAGARDTGNARAEIRSVGLLRAVVVRIIEAVPVAVQLTFVRDVVRSRCTARAYLILAGAISDIASVGNAVAIAVITPRLSDWIGAISDFYTVTVTVAVVGSVCLDVRVTATFGYGQGSCSSLSSKT